MRRRLRLLGLAAGTCALGTGCEFWSNLTGNKTADRADLEVTVRDAFTGAPMPGVSCTLAVDARAADSDAEGRIRWEAVPTGPGKVRCGEALYHPAEADADVRRAGGAATVDMARLGGASWYDEDSLRVDLAVSEVAGGLRYPGGRLSLRATPARSDGKLVYHWSSTAPRSEPLRPLTEVPEVLIRNGEMPGDQVEDRLTVKVEAHLGDRVYVVGTDTLLLILVRNQKPVIALSDAFWTETPNMGNCLRRLTESLRFTALDPDGRCNRIRLYSRDQFSPLGNLDTILECTSLAHAPRLPLVNWPAQGGSPQPLPSSLFIEVKDDNDVDSTLELRFTVTPNALPELALSALDNEAALFAGEPLRFRLSVKDVNNPVEAVDVDWRDGATSRFRPETGREPNQADTTLTHVYASPGTYAIEARTRDACGGAGSVQLSVTVQPARAAAGP